MTPSGQVYGAALNFRGSIEALRDALRQRKTTPSELMKYAAIDRVAERMEPYIKAMQ